MAAKPIAVGLCLDETGSMNGCKAATISGFNEYVAGLTKTATLTVTMFSDVAHSEPTYRLYCENEKAAKVKPLDEASYRPRGNTPLYDAIGHTVRSMEATLKGKPTVLFVIQTDGQENASREWTRKQVFDLIREKEAAGWKFIYLGADQDTYAAERAAQSMGLMAGATFSYDSASTGQTYASLRNVTHSVAATPNMTSAQAAQGMAQPPQDPPKKRKAPAKP